MVNNSRGGSTVLRDLRAGETVPVEVSGRRLTQRRVIDLMRHAGAVCRSC